MKLHTKFCEEMLIFEEVIAISQNTLFLKNFAIISPKPYICYKNPSDMLKILLIRNYTQNFEKK